MIGGVIGWLFRSSIDVFYIRFRDRKNTEKAIRRDLESIKSAYELLKQKAFLAALSTKDFAAAEEIAPIATLRAKEVKSDYTSLYGSAFFLLPEEKLGIALDTYRRIQASRIVFSKISEHVENERWDSAAEIAKSAMPLFNSTEEALNTALKVF